MGVLLDENIPVDLAGLRSDHDAQTVSGFGWDGVKNGELLRRACRSPRRLAARRRLSTTV